MTCFAGCLWELWVNFVWSMLIALWWQSSAMHLRLLRILLMTECYCCLLIGDQLGHINLFYSWCCFSAFLVHFWYWVESWPFFRSSYIKPVRVPCKVLVSKICDCGWTISLCIREYYFSSFKFIEMIAFRFRMLMIDTHSSLSFQSSSSKSWNQLLCSSLEFW